MGGYRGVIFFQLLFGLVKQTTVEFLAGDNLLIYKKGQIPTLPVFRCAKLQKHKDSLIDFEIDFDDLFSDVLDLCQVKQLVISARFGGHKDEHLVLDDLSCGHFVVYLIVVVFFDE